MDQANGLSASVYDLVGVGGSGTWTIEGPGNEVQYA